MTNFASNKTLYLQNIVKLLTINYTILAIGCGDITPPEGTWVRREGDETTLGCHSGRHSWTLTCEHKPVGGRCGQLWHRSV